MSLYSLIKNKYWTLISNVFCTRMHNLKHAKKNNELLIWKTYKKWVGCSTICFTSNLFLQTFFQSGNMVISTNYHSSTRTFTSGDSASDHCLLVVPNQKSKSPLSIRKECCLQFRTHLLDNPRCWATFLPLVWIDATKVPKNFLAATCLAICPLAMCAETQSLIFSTISWLFIESCRLDKHFGINGVITSWINIFSTTFYWNPTS